MRKSYSKTQTTETSQQREKKRRIIQTEITTTTRACFCRACVFRARVYMITFAKLFNHKYFSILLFFLLFLRKISSRQLFFVFLPLALENGGEDGLLKLRLKYIRRFVYSARKEHTKARRREYEA